MLPLKEFIKNYIEEGKEILKEGFAEAMEKLEAERGASYEYTGEEAEIVQKINQLR